ncbi:TRAFAC clade GTPase domain-containing protein, partial [Acetobacter fabarum]
LSALERPLSPTTRDMDYASKGPEHFGYVIEANGTKSSDLTLPIHHLLNAGS